MIFLKIFISTIACRQGAVLLTTPVWCLRISLINSMSKKIFFKNQKNCILNAHRKTDSHGTLTTFSIYQNHQVEFKMLVSNCNSKNAQKRLFLHANAKTLIFEIFAFISQNVLLTCETRKVTLNSLWRIPLQTTTKNRIWFQAFLTQFGDFGKLKMWWACHADLSCGERSNMCFLRIFDFFWW